MKKALIVFSIYILFLSVVYLAMSFSNWSSDARRWSGGSRDGFAFMMVFLFIGAILATIGLNIEEK